MEKISIIRMNDTGAGIGKIKGKVVFVPKTMPGDVVIIDNIKKYKNHDEGELISVIEASENRVKPLCPFFEQCGGCDIMEMNYESQLKYKAKKVKGLLRKYANLNIYPTIVGGSQFHYRNKIILHVKEGKLGLYANNSNDLVPIDKCFLVSENVNKIINLIQEKVNLNTVERILIRENSNKLLVAFYGVIDEEATISALKDSVSSLYLNDKHLYNEKYLLETLDNRKFKISKDSFFQINKEQTLNIYNKVKEYSKDSQRIMDLYCGTGSIGIYIKENNEVLGIELNESSIADANYNKKLNNLENIEFKCGNVSELIDTTKYYDTVIVDPPRSGLSKRTRDLLLAIESNKIIYISCNPVTFARDIDYLSCKYDVKEITLYDMFPNTNHVECVCVLEI